MTTFTAFTTLEGEEPAVALGEAMEVLSPAPTGVGVFEIEDGSGRWEVAGYFSERPDAVAMALLAAAHGARDFAISKLDDHDWVAQVRRELHPVDAGRFTVYGAHDSHRVHENRINLLIEAAMAFGTGHHGTTRGCLTLFDRLLRRRFRPARCADVGSGTGVLAMAAARALRIPCVATDIDPIAAQTARANVVANGASPWIKTGTAVGFRHQVYRQRFDLIFANILASPLKRLARDMAFHLSDDGRLILAGLLTAQSKSVAAVYRGHGLHIVDRVVLDEWTCLTLARRK